MKDYGHLLRDEPEWAERAAALRGARCATSPSCSPRPEPRAERQPVPLKVAYHDACHLAHAQGVRAQPRELLRGIPGLELVEPAEWELCCGSAGIYNLVQPEPAAASWASARRATCSPPAPRRSPRPTRAARSRSPPTPPGWGAAARAAPDELLDRSIAPAE